jgi:hypothetical protein
MSHVPNEGADMPRIASSESVVPKEMSAAERAALGDALYEVHCEIFDGVDRQAFMRYVVESRAEKTKILIYRSAEGAIVGYFALHFFAKRLRGRAATIVRGETGTLRAYRGGGSYLSWGIRELTEHALAHRGEPMYGLSCLVHPSSYLIAARYLDEVWPKPGEPVPADILELMLELADEFHLDVVDPRRPLVRKVGWTTRDTEVERAYWRQCDKPAARFYVSSNPGYVQGHGLLTMAPLELGAIALGAARFARGKLDLAIQGALAAAQQLPLGASLLRPGEVRRRLRAVPLFAALDAPMLEKLVETAEVVPIHAGAYLFRQGDEGDAMYLIARGAVYVIADGQQEEDVIDQLGAGAFFGEVAMLAGGRRSASIRTAIASTLVRIPGSAVRSLMQSNAEVRETIWSAFAARVFDDHVRAAGRYPELGREGRRAWVRKGRHEDLEAGAAIQTAGDAFVLVLHGSVSIEQGDTLLSAQGPIVIETDTSARVIAKTPMRVVHVPPMASATPAPTGS